MALSDEFPYLNFSEAWASFVGALRKLWHGETIGPRAHLGFYMNVRDQALRASSEGGFVGTLQESWLGMRGSDRGRMNADLFLAEMTGFTQAVASLPSPPGDDTGQTQPTQGQTDADDHQRRDLLGDASTILGSIKDIFESLPSWAKATIHILREIADLLKRK